MSSERVARRAVGVFADLSYVPSLAALINSILHFGVQARIKVYDFGGLPHLARSYLSRFAEITAPPAEVFGEDYRRDWNYRPRVLAATGVAASEIQVDADTLVLSDLEEAFREVEKGKLVLVRDGLLQRPQAGRKDLPSGSFFHRHLANPEIYKDELVIYNGGFLGFNREAHAHVLDLWAGATRAPELADTLFWLDQNKLALIVASLLEEGRLEIHELPQELWMQLWKQHGEPKKFVGFEDGSVGLYNGSWDKKMRFYHYTGGVTAPERLVGKRDTYPVRFNDQVSDLGVPKGLTPDQMTDSWHDVWRRRHASAAGELPLFFYRLGPVRAPSCLDPSWRRRLARLLRQQPGLGDVQQDSRETWALALAYDYVDFCGYRAVDMGWMAGTLASLLDPQDLETGTRTLSWEGSGDVTLAFQPAFAERREWTGVDGVFRTQYSEHHRGVWVNVG